MRTKGANDVGRFSIDFEIANYEDMVLAQRGALPADRVRRRTISGLVDPGATMLVLPPTVVKELGLPMRDKMLVRYADGRQTQRRKAEAVYVEILGRHDTFSAVVEPKRTTALVGAVVLEVLDLLVDNGRQRLIPRDPRSIIYEIE
jgi:predicted aspartyl protease